MLKGGRVGWLVFRGGRVKGCYDPSEDAVGQSAGVGLDRSEVSTREQ